MIRLNPNSPRHGIAAGVFLLSLALAAPASAQDAAPVIQTPTETAVMQDIMQTLGGVPAFVKQFPKSALAALWLEERDLEVSPKTALDTKTKALISLAVAAQIPCQYCVWSDTENAKRAGASNEEIAEAVAMAGLTRNTSTLLNGLQVDFEQFKKDMGGGQ